MNGQPGTMGSGNGDACPVCGHRESTYLMNPHGLAYFACDACALVRLSPRPTEDEIKKIYEGTTLDETTLAESTDTMAERAKRYWHQLAQASGVERERSAILVLASEPRAILEAGRELGFKNIRSCPGAVESLEGTEPASFDAALVVFAVERMPNPVVGLQRLHRLLKPEGVLLLVMPMLNSWPARFFRDAWTEFRPENLFFFDTQNIQSTLAECGFHHVLLRPDRPRYTLHHIHYRACMYPRTRLTRFIRRVLRPFPTDFMRRMRVRAPSSAFMIVARKNDLRPRKVLSIVMPVFNEQQTFRECFDRVLAKSVKGVDKEIIVVESNSTDGTRELVEAIHREEGVKVILQDRPKGKGNAVRAGLQAVSGDIVMIQDADLEYDVHDYDALVHPILTHRTAFVLGSRHTGSWKMRQFNDQKMSATFFNMGHTFFRGLLNLFYGQSLKDPFTMYKVFRADCLYGLAFQCDRFDFDFEIVIKLVRKGYTPLEVPVNYRARSFKEGKKVSALRDPWTWLWALVKYRFSKMDVLSEVERRREGGPA